MKDSEVIVTTIKNVTQMINTGNENAILAMAIRGTTEAKLAAAKDKGELANSVQYVTGKGFSGGFNDQSGGLRSDQHQTADEKLTVSLKSDEAAIGATSKHAPWLEFGTRYQAPQVFLRSSLALIAGESVELVKAKMKYEFAKGPLKYGQSRVKF